jgi:hypothetical protein
VNDEIVVKYIEMWKKRRRGQQADQIQLRRSHDTKSCDVSFHERLPDGNIYVVYFALLEYDLWRVNNKDARSQNIEWSREQYL